jgi:N-acetylglucosamine kinase-like BadF-type ATPase
MDQSHLILGLDAGGTKTVAWLAPGASDVPFGALGVGVGGPGNPHSVGLEAACSAYMAAINEAFSNAAIEPRPVTAICLAVAGAGREDDRRRIAQWAADLRIADRIAVVSDADAVLAAGTPNACGVGVIAGTGSIVFGRDAHGREFRAGGWGPLLGDEGSAFALATSGLRAASHAIDCRGPATVLAEAFMVRLGIAEPRMLVNAIYDSRMDRRAIAALADVVTAAANRDSTADELLSQTARELGDQVSAVVRSLQFAPGEYSLVLAGGLLVGCELLRWRLVDTLITDGNWPVSIHVVPDPVVGAIRIAQRLLVPNVRDPSIGD